jgi:4-hydroxy-2-oxoheptanedioate aldolase
MAFRVAGRPTAGGWSDLGDPAAAEILANAGYDWLVVDMQHGRFDEPTVLHTAALLAANPIEVIVRVTHNADAVIGRALDAGADGVLVPMIDNAADARSAVAAVKYPPLGRRSWGQLLAIHGRPVPDAATANKRTRCTVMIETAAALAEVDAIAATPGVDALFVGPFDLSLALGTTLPDLLADDRPDAPLRRIVAACERHGVASAAFGGTRERADRLAQLGFSAVAVATDTNLLLAGATASLIDWPPPAE